MAHHAYRGLAALFAATLTATPALASDVKIGDLMLEHPYSRATPPKALTGAGYVTIHNHGSTTDRLIAVSCDCAAASEVHEMKMDGNVMRMRELTDGLPIPANGMVELKPGGYHLMFIGLKDPLKEGEVVEATLTFEKAGSVDVEFAIGRIGQMKGRHGHGDHSHGDHGKKGHGSHKSQ